MSTFTDTSVRISLATPDDVRELSQRSLHFWIGASSPFWAPFWMAASFGVGLWSVGQGAARALGGTLYDKDLPLAVKWPGFEALPKPVGALSPVVEKAAEEVVAATTQAVDETADTQANAMLAVEDVVEAPAKAVEAATEATTIAAATTARTSAILAKKAAEATLDLLSGQSTIKAEARGTRPLIDPVTEAPVIPAVAEAISEPKPPSAKPVPRRPRKS